MVPTAAAVESSRMDAALLERLQDAAARLFPTHGILVAYAFGSRVNGHPRPDDVGYHVDGHPPHEALPLDKELALAAELEATLGVVVDLRALGGAPLELRGRVLEDGVRIFTGDPARRVALERQLLAAYHDYKREFAEFHRLRLQATAEQGP